MKKIYLLTLLVVVLFSCANHADKPTCSTSEEFDESATIEGKGTIGIDISHHQGTIDWNVVKANYPDLAFVYVKCTEGKTHVDPDFIKNAKSASDHGYRVGGYHYFRMTSSAHEQFNHFKKQLSAVNISLRPMVDVETDDKASRRALQDSLRTFLNLLEMEYGVKPVIYGTNRSYNTYCAPEFNDYPLYIGRYGNQAPVVKGHSHYMVWQYSEKGKIEGIPEYVDLCRFHPDNGIENLLLNQNIKSVESQSYEYVEVKETDSLTIYHPNFSRIDLLTGEMPDRLIDANVVFCCEAAFTGECLTEFKHTNIAGDHVSSGERFRGYRCKRNTGAFVWYNNGWKFLWKEYSHELDSAAKHNGMGFGQEMIIHQGELCETFRKDGNVNQFRALCEVDGQVCVIDGKTAMAFGAFKKQLVAYGVKEALYLDMGPGWNHSWYRDENGNAVDIFPYQHAYCTNWLTFYR